MENGGGKCRGRVALRISIFTLALIKMNLTDSAPAKPVLAPEAGGRRKHQIIGFMA